MFGLTFSAAYLTAIGYAFGGFLTSFLVMYAIWIYILGFAKSKFTKSEFYFLPKTLRDINLQVVLFVFLSSIYLGMEFGFPGSMIRTIWGKIFGVLLFIFAFEGVIRFIINAINAYHSKSRKKLNISSNVLISLNRIVAIILYTVAIIIIVNYLSTEIGNVMIILSILLIILLFIIYYKQIQNIISSLSILQGSLHEGDFISINGCRGFIEKVLSQETVIHLVDGSRISIPNARFLDSSIVNYSLPYGSQLIYVITLSKSSTRKDFEKLKNIAHKVGSKTSGIDSDYKPQTLMIGKRDGNFIFRIRFMIQTNADIMQISDVFCNELSKGLGAKFIECK